MIKISETITLEPLSEQHTRPVYDLIVKNRAQMEKWLQWVEHIHSENDLQQFFNGVQQRVANKVALPFFIRYEGKIAGNIGLYHLDHLNKIGAIGYWLGAEFQGKGIITQACRTIIQYGFTEVGLNRIELKCNRENLKSKAIPERLGFTREAILRQAELLNGKFEDLYLFSLLKSEWGNAPDPAKS